MKKIVLTFGLISGAILSGMMLITLPFHDALGFDRSLILGYTSMVLAFILVFFGIRSYRENVGGGAITFGRAFIVGILIAGISSICYVIAWEILYHTLMPDFMDKYSAHVIEQARAAGANAQAIQAKQQELQQIRQLYSNPFANIAMTLLEPLPVGLVITVISAAILRKKK
jgi:hypothetical protein